VHNDTVAVMLRRLAAWLVCGPVGHGVAGIVDLAAVVWSARRARRRRAR
jgi:hypothetical protein